MKIFICDVCKKVIGREVSWSISPYLQSEFYYTPKTHSDICSDCFNKIAEAQNKVIEEIRESVK